VYLKRAKARKMPRIKRRELEDLIDAVEAENVIQLPQPETVGISDGRIWVKPNRFFVVRPLESSDLFMSFAKLAASGEPSEARIKRWVSRFGLPVQVAPNRRGPVTSKVVEVSDQDGTATLTIPDYDPVSMEVREFREEALYAHDLLDTYLKIRDEDAAGLRAKIRGPKSRLDREFCNAFKENQRRWGLYAGPDTGRDLPDGMTYHELRDHLTILAAQCALGEITTRLVSGVQLRVGVLDTRGLTSSWTCSDLRSALYLQFYRLIIKSKPIRYCDNCGQPFEATRSNRRFCDPSCRSGIRYEPRQS
jgi:hypothetical protein